MINLKQHSTIADNIIISYVGPGYYSGKAVRPLQDDIILVKVAEIEHDKEEVYQMCKVNGYKVKPYKLKDSSFIPSHWNIDNTVDIYEDEENY